MCLFFCAFELHPEYRLIIAANRDYFRKLQAFCREAPDGFALRPLMAQVAGHQLAILDGLPVRPLPQ